MAECKEAPRVSFTWKLEEETLEFLISLSGTKGK